MKNLVNRALVAKEKNNLSIAILIIVCMFSQIVSAQLKINSVGNVGIGLGTNVEPASLLSIGNAGLSSSKVYIYSQGHNEGGDRYGIYSRMSWGATNGCKYAVYGFSQAHNGSQIGVKGEASAISSNYRNVNTYGVYGSAGGGNYGRNYGVYGMLLTGDQYGSGVYGTNDDTPEPLTSRYAGYFRGNTYVNGNFNAESMFNSSDARLKTNIVAIRTDAINKLNELRPVQFQWQQVEEIITVDTVTIKTPHFSSDIDFDIKHYGLLAQEVQKIFPDLVKEDGTGYLSVNYIELIPLLIQAVQELSSELLLQKEQLDILNRKNAQQ